MDWTPASFLNESEAHPVPLDMLLLHTFGAQYYNWEPETLWLELRREFQASPPQYNRDAVQAVRMIHMNDRFANDWYTFEKVVIGLNNLPVSFQYGQQPTVGQVMDAINSINWIRPVKLSDDVRMYVAAVIREDGVYPVPKLLQNACGGLEDLVPAAEPNDNGRDDEEYFQARHAIMREQAKSVLSFVEAKK